MRRTCGVVLAAAVLATASSAAVPHDKATSKETDLSAINKVAFETAYAGSRKAYVIVEKTHSLKLQSNPGFKARIPHLAALQRAFNRANATAGKPTHFQSKIAIGWFLEPDISTKPTPAWRAWKADHPNFGAYVQLSKPVLSADGKYAIAQVFERGGFYEKWWIMLLERTGLGFRLIEKPICCTAVS